MDQMLGNLWKGDFHETKSIFKRYESKNGRLWKANGPERNVFCKNEAMRREQILFFGTRWFPPR